MQVRTAPGFDGEGDLFTKFGVEIRDEATFVVSRRRWNSTVSAVNNQISGVRPREGDLIYLPLSNSLFEITFVEHEQPFYQLANLPTFKIPLIAAENIGIGGFKEKVFSAAEFILRSINQSQEAAF